VLGFDLKIMVDVLDRDMRLVNNHTVGLQLFKEKE
jgi:hypothetical protein